ncbi:hypothetical protein [Nocardia sp. NPDC052566]|uniref:hypothetical protein n=1 Tax=Nocardia sp. NPDC052566 TaxID=3364330 RepID=UPI0037CB45C8
MTKTLSATLLAAVAGSLLMLPASPAHAQSAACSAAVDVINSALDAAPNRELDGDAQKALATKLLAINASGGDKDAINAFVQAIVDDAVTDLEPAIDAFNNVCAR